MAPKNIRFVLKSIKLPLIKTEVLSLPIILKLPAPSAKNPAPVVSVFVVIVPKESLLLVFVLLCALRRNPVAVKDTVVEINLRVSLAPSNIN